MRPHFSKIAIIGTGFIGGSLGLAIKASGIADAVIGMDASGIALEEARSIQAIDQVETNLTAAVRGCALVILASPVGTFRDIVTSLHSAMDDDAILTDVGSVKESVVTQIETALPSRVHFIGTHPIAGSEKSSALHSHSNLFENMPCVITPTIRTNQEALSTISSFWEALGSTVVTMEAKQHDIIFGALSHLPHVIAYATLNSIAAIHDTRFSDADFGKFMPRSLKDMTRIASSSPALWSDICCRNADNLVSMLETYQQEIACLIDLVKQGDSAALQCAFSKAKQLRDDAC